MYKIHYKNILAGVGTIIVIFISLYIAIFSNASNISLYENHGFEQESNNQPENIFPESKFIKIYKTSINNFNVDQITEEIFPDPNNKVVNSEDLGNNSAVLAETNDPGRPFITLIKEVEPDSNPYKFRIKVFEKGYEKTRSSVTAILSDNNQRIPPVNSVGVGLEVGKTYTIKEISTTDPIGLRSCYTSYKCEITSPAGNREIQDTGLSFDITPKKGENYNCTFTNKQESIIQVVKEVEPGHSPFEFSYELRLFRENASIQEDTGKVYENIIVPDNDNKSPVCVDYAAHIPDSLKAVYPLSATYQFGGTFIVPNGEIETEKKKQYADWYYYVLDEVGTTDPGGISSYSTRASCFRATKDSWVFSLGNIPFSPSTRAFPIDPAPGYINVCIFKNTKNKIITR